MTESGVDRVKEIKYINTLHRESMDLTENAFLLKRRATSLLKEALEKESEAARLIPKDAKNEPSRSIIYKSAASLALDCKQPKEAVLLATEGLKGTPPLEIKKELQEILDEAKEFPSWMLK
jgi:hypothetical protein